MLCDSMENSQHQAALVAQQMALTALVVAGFVCTKALYDRLRRRQARITVVVVGAGPVGLTSVLVAARSGRVKRIVLYDELGKKTLVNTNHQIALDRESVAFLQRLGVDFDNIEGCWDHGCFFTRMGIFQEYMLTLIARLHLAIDVRLGTKFTRESAKEVETLPGRTLVIACDGANGHAGRMLGLSDEFVHHSCRAFGAVAALERTDQPHVPMAERRVHNLVFDLAAYGADAFENGDAPGFTLKIFGSSRYRYMALAVPRCESPMVKTLRVVLDRSMMRNIFLKCFNTYKGEGEATLSDSFVLKHMKFSPRLFEIKLSQRLETVAYFDESDTFVLTEGEAARCYNIHTGMDVNVGMKGLQSLSTFITMAAWAETEHMVMKALHYKSKQADLVCKNFLKSGLSEYMLGVR